MAGNRLDRDRLDVDSVRPTQLYLNAEKLATVLERVEGDEFDPGPLPVYEFDGGLYLTDGHTRAFTAWLTGADSVAIEYDDDLAEEHDVALYRECIRWCEAESVDRIPDLAGRVLGPDIYEKQWIERCHRTADRLDDG